MDDDKQKHLSIISEDERQHHLVTITERDILLSKLCAKWEKLERRLTMILDQKLRDLRDKNKLLRKDVQEANKVVLVMHGESNKLISDLCIELEKLERKSKMVLDC